MSAMNTEDEIDAWAENDFSLPKVEIRPADDPWALNTRSRGATAPTRDSEDSASSEEAASSKPGIYVPPVAPIKPYAPPTSSQTNRNGADAAAGTKNNRSTALPPPCVQETQSTSTLDSHNSEVDEPKPNKKRSTQSDDDPWGFRIPSNRSHPSIPDVSSTNRQHDTESIDLEEFPEFLDEDFRLGDDGEAANLGANKETESVSDFYDYAHDEPDVTAEYEKDLHQNLFDSKETPHDINRHLIVNEWLASIDDFDITLMDLITATLVSFPSRKFTYWINWLRTKQWDEVTLSQFIELRSYWDETEVLWQCLIWSAKQKSWYRSQNHSSLSLDKTYALIHNHHQFSTDASIDEDWLVDWDELETWSLVRSKITSFATFAVYRSMLSCGEDWLRRPEFGVDLEFSLNHDYHETPMSYSSSELSGIYTINEMDAWFDNQDWYPKHEWHGGYY